MFSQLRLKSCTLLAILLFLFISHGQGQLTFHTDANENSYTIKTPGVQQSFTRFYGGGQRGNLVSQTGSASAAAVAVAAHEAQQQEQQQQQQQQYQQYQQQLQQYQQLKQQQQQVQFANGGQSIYQSSTPEGSSRYATQSYVQPQAASPSSLELMQSSYNDYQTHRQLYAQEQQQLQQQQEQQRQRLQQQYQQQQLLQQLYAQQRPQAAGVPALPTQSQTQALTAEQYAQYLTQQQHRLLRQQQEQMQQEFLQRGQTSTPVREATSEKLLGVSYSPSDKVSHVNFASGNLKYNF